MNMNQGNRYCVYGGSFGSEGKGCVAEFVIKNYITNHNNLLVLGENAPNSGHTDSQGHKTQSLPVSSYHARKVLLGPDSAIDVELLVKEIAEIRKVNPQVEVFVHENAAIIIDSDKSYEACSGLVARISSTAQGGGYARSDKAQNRSTGRVIGSDYKSNHSFRILSRLEYFLFLEEHYCWDWVLECSQGLMLDLNLGYYPYVTSRTTHPRAVIERNGWGPSEDWGMLGCYRCHPIRTGGPSGPTGGKELRWSDLGRPDEITAVTKRVRRVFEFDGKEFVRSLRMVHPTAIFFTHMDYLTTAQCNDFRGWLRGHIVDKLSETDRQFQILGRTHVFGSSSPSAFVPFGALLDTKEIVS